MAFWPHAWDTATGERLGPWFDLFVGTEGRTADLYAAYVTHGARRIVLGTGATLSANLTIAANDVYIFSPFHPRALNLGAKKITVTGVQVYLAGFKLSGAGAGIEVNSSGGANLERMAVENATSHGVYFNVTANDLQVTNCWLYANGGDGLRLSSSSSCRVTNCMIYGNTGYGVNDTGNSSVLVANRIAGNTAGNINGTPSVNTGNKTT